MLGRQLVGVFFFLVSFVLRCFYKSTLVVCAVARTVSRFVQLSFDLH